MKQSKCEGFVGYDNVCVCVCVWVGGWVWSHPHILLEGESVIF